LFDDIVKTGSDLWEVPEEYALTLTGKKRPEDYNALHSGLQKKLNPAVRFWLMKIGTRTNGKTLACMLLSERKAQTGTAFAKKSRSFLQRGH
jgi:hypothetical protein